MTMPPAILTQASRPSSSVPLAALKLPPGCRFYPSDQQLLGHYLPTKNQIQMHIPDQRNYNWNVIQEFDLYDYSPFELPQSLCFLYGKGGSRRHWFFYAVNGEEGNGSKYRRVKGGGFWKMRGKVKEVKGETDDGAVTLGSRTRFVFYQREGVHYGVRTQWVMYEYSLPVNLEVPFVACRIYAKPQKQNAIPTNAINNALAEVRHLAGRRCADHANGAASSENAGRGRRNVKYVHMEFDIPFDPVLMSPIATQVPLQNRAPEPVIRHPMHAIEGWLPDDLFDMQQLVPIQGYDSPGREAFLEMDDLIDPL